MCFLLLQLAEALNGSNGSWKTADRWFGPVLFFLAGRVTVILNEWVPTLSIHFSLRVTVTASLVNLFCHPPAFIWLAQSFRASPEVQTSPTFLLIPIDWRVKHSIFKMFLIYFKHTCLTSPNLVILSHSFSLLCKHWAVPCSRDYVKYSKCFILFSTQADLSVIIIIIPIL